MKRLLPLIIFVGFAAFVIYQRNPGVKAKVDGAVNKYGGWTEEARKENPTGYIDYAMDELKTQQTNFQARVAEYGKNRSKYEAELKKAEAKVVKANEIANNMKGAFQVAKTDQSWPVNVLGKPYTEDQLVTQVSTVLHEKKINEGIITQYADAIATIDTQNKALVKSIADIDGELVKLETSKATAEIEKLNADTESMLANVNDLLSGNADKLNEFGDSPIRSVDDINLSTETESEEAKAATVANKEVMDFLEGI